MNKYKYDEIPQFSELSKSLQNKIIKEVEADFPQEAELLKNGNLEDEDGLQDYIIHVLEENDKIEY